MRHLPTDLEILNAIYERYYDAFVSFSEGDTNRSAKIYVPIDISQIAKDMGVDTDIVFGRLYYHLEEKYGYKRDDGSHVNFFALKIGRDHNCVNFPYVASVLANLRDEKRKYRIATSVAFSSLIIAIISILLSIFLFS